MEFMKVFDQTVRDLKREVNKSILKVPEIEQKVLDATSNEAWGPHGTLMSEIAQSTRNYTEFQMIMGVLWKRLADTGKNWRHVYKALTVLEFLVAHGSERVIDEIRQYSYQIATLADFQYLELNGKDQGINVRKKSQSLLALVNDKDKIKEVREKAVANRDKYRGISSSGGISSASSYRSAGGGFGGGGYGEYNTSRYARDNDQYPDEDRYDSDWDRPSRDQDGYRNRRNGNDFKQHTEPDNERQNEDESNAKYSSIDRDHEVGDWGKDDSLWQDERSAPAAAGQASSTMHKKPEIIESDDFDDFDPRASTGTAATARSNVPAQLEPLGGVSSWSSSTDLLGDFSTTDLLGDLSSAAPASSGSSLQQPGGNAFEGSLLKTEPSFFPSFPSAPANNAASSISTPPLDKFATTTSSTGTGSSDPFADFSMNQNATTSYGGTDLFQDQSFGAFVSAQGGTETPSQMDVPANTSFQMKQAATPQPVQQLSSLEPQKPKGSLNSASKPQQDKLELKSTVWADSLSKGLIDLNLAAPKSTSLADIGIEYGLFQNENLKEERPGAKTSTIGKGKAMGSGSGLGLAGASALAPPPGPAMMSNLTMGSDIGRGFSPAMSSNAGMPNLYTNPGMGTRPGITDFSSLGMGIGMGTGMGGYSTQQKS